MPSWDELTPVKEPAPTKPVDWSQFKPARPRWSDLTPVEESGLFNKELRNLPDMQTTTRGGPKLVTPEASVALPAFTEDFLSENRLAEVTPYLGNIVRGGVADLGAGLSLFSGDKDATIARNLPYAAKASGNLPAAILNEDRLPIDEILSEASKESKFAATVGKISQGVAGTAPLAVIGALPAAAQKLVLLGFTAQMMMDVPKVASELGEELGKPKEEQDPDKITSLVSQGIQDIGFSALGGSHLLKAGARTLSEIKYGLDTAKRMSPRAPLAPESSKAVEPALESPVDPVAKEVAPATATVFEENKAKDAATRDFFVSDLTFADNAPPKFLHATHLEQKNPRLLRVAAKTPDGGVIEGKPGQIHALLEFPEGSEMGFVTPEGKFLNREEASKFSVSQPEIVGMGGAVPSEFNTPGDYVSNMFAAIERDRAAMGKDPMPDTQTRSWDADNRKALAKMNQEPEWIPSLLESVSANPRPLLSWENAGVVWYRQKLKAEFNNANERINRAYEDGRTEDLATAQAEASAYESSLLKLDEVVGRNGAGSEAGRSLQAQKMGAGEDFTLIEMLLEKRASQGGKPLTEPQRAEVMALHKKIAETQKAFDDYVAKTEAENAKRSAQEAIGELEKTQPPPEIEPHVKIIADKIRDYFDKRADAALERMSGKLFTISPQLFLDLTDLGVSRILQGAAGFTSWSVKMIEAIREKSGEHAESNIAKVTPHLKAIHDAAIRELDSHAAKASGQEKMRVRKALESPTPEKQLADISEQIKERISSGDKGGIRPLVQKLARQFIEQGIKDRESLIDAVHMALKEVAPEMTRRETMDAISGYGDFKQLSKDEISVKLRDLKGQMQQVGKLEDIQSKKPPLKSGVERRLPSDEERALIKQVNEAKRKYGIVVTDPATQLKSALEARKTYYKHQIDDLTAQIEAKERTVKTKTPSPTDAELEGLKAKRTELKKQFDEVFAKEKEAEDLQRQKANLEKNIAEQERRLKEGDIHPEPKQVNRPLNPELESLKQRQEALASQIREARKKPESERYADKLQKQLESMQERIKQKEAQIASGDVATKPQKQNRPLPPELEQAKQKLEELNQKIHEIRHPKLSDDALALKALKSRLESQIRTYQERLAKGDFSKKQPKNVQMDPEANRLHFEMTKAKRAWYEAQFEDRLKRRTKLEKAIGGLGEGLSVYRGLKGSADLSAVLRQAGFITIGDPVLAAKAFPDMLRAFASEKGQHAVEQEIISRENYPLYKKAGLYLAEHGMDLSKMEEAYQSRLIRKIPIAAHSERAYVTFLNRVRADAFDAMLKEVTGGRGGDASLVEAKALANFINVATGRGNIGTLNQSLVLLNKVYWSPRNVISRAQLLTGQPFWQIPKEGSGFWRGSGRTRKAIAKRYARFIIGLAAIYSIAKSDDAELEENPNSSDFGKIKYGTVRVDPTAGLSSVATFGSRMATGMTQSLSGQPASLIDNKKFGSQDMGDVLGRFNRSKLAPAVAEFYNWRTGKDMMGKTFNPIDALPAPLTIGDVASALEAEGMHRQVAIAIAAILGAGVNDYAK